MKKTPTSFITRKFSASCFTTVFKEFFFFLNGVVAMFLFFVLGNYSYVGHAKKKSNHKSLKKKTNNHSISYLVIFSL